MSNATGATSSSSSKKLEQHPGIKELIVAMENATTKPSLEPNGALERHVDMTLLHGPPGTGKTYETQMANYAAVQSGHCTITVAKSHKVVAVALRMYNEIRDKYAEPDSPAMKHPPLHFSSSNYRKRHYEAEPESEKLEDVAVDEIDMFQQAEQILGKAEDKSLGIFAYGVQRQIHIRRCADLDAENDPTDSLAARYLDVVEQVLKLSQGTSKKVKDQKFYDLQSVINEYDKIFLQQEGKAIFVTLDTSGHDVLCKNYAPTKIFIEDASQVFPWEVIVPIGAFKQSLKHAFLSGDNEQLGPFVPENLGDEARNLSKESLLHQLIHDPRKRYTAQRLDTQYRMHPSIADFPGLLKYATDDTRKESWLKSTDMTWKDNYPVEEPLLKLFAPLKLIGWTGDKQRLICIDVPGEAESARGWQNPAEARVAVWLIEMIIKSMPATKFRLAILTSYIGQQRLILKMLAEKCIQGIFVVSTLEMPGDEYDVVINSLVSNNHVNPLDVGRIIQGEIINVSHSRAKRLQIDLAGWRPWIKASMSVGSKEFFKLGQKKYADFKFMVNYMKRKDLVFSLEAVEWALSDRSTPRAAISPSITQQLVSDPQDRFMAGSKSDILRLTGV